MRFVKFIRKDDLPVLINLDHVIGCVPVDQAETELIHTLPVPANERLIVKATLGEILHGAYREDPEIPRRKAPEPGVREPLVVNEGSGIESWR